MASSHRAPLPLRRASLVLPEYVEKAEFEDRTHVMDDMMEQMVERLADLEKKEKADYALTYLDDLIDI